MNKFIRALKLAKTSRTRGVSMRVRLLMYLGTMTLAVLGVMILVLIATGTAFDGEGEAGNRLKIQAETTAASLQESIDLLSGYGRSLSDNVGREIDFFLDGRSIRELNDQPEQLLALEKTIYSEINTTLKLARCSGCFAVLDATINTKAPGAESSRSGVYLRLSNVNSTVQLDPDIYYYRGIPDIAREKGLELHNRWNMEFSLDSLTNYYDMVYGGENKAIDFWSDKLHLQHTWEDVMVYMVPLKSKQGGIYGICGIDISSLFMQLSYPVTESEFGPMIVVLAPIEDGQLKTGKGLIGGQGGTWLDYFPNLTVKEKGKLNYYSSTTDTYVGYHTMMSMHGENDKQWACAILIPESTYGAFKASVRTKWIFSLLAFILIMTILSLVISKKYVSPFVKSLDTLRNNEVLPDGKTGISELDILFQFMRTIPKTEAITTSALPDNVEELFLRFTEGTKKLTAAEYNIFHLYMEGYIISDIPDQACISMSTVKKHNRNIYDKLNISSYEELMLYLDLFERCNRMKDLERDETTAEEV